MTDDAEEIKIETSIRKSTSGRKSSARKSTDQYLELTEHANVDKNTTPQEPPSLLWPSFIKDHGASLFRRDKMFKHEKEGEFILLHNDDGIRVFDTSLDRLDPVLTVDDNLIPVDRDTYAEFSDLAKYVLVNVGREQSPEDWCVKVYRVSPEGGDQCLCELKASDVSEDIPSQAAAQATWVTSDCFTIYCFDEGTNYASRYIFRVNPDDEPHVQCVVKCPMLQVTDDRPDYLRARVGESDFVLRDGRYYGTTLAIGLITKHSCWEMYAVQENFRPLGTLCPFGNERNIRASWSESARYCGFYYLDDNESNREVCVYDFGPDPSHLVMRECFKAPMFPGESYDDVSLSFYQSATTTLLYLMCSAEQKEVVVVYDLGKTDELKSDAKMIRKTSMAAMELNVAELRVFQLEHVTSNKDQGTAYGAFGAVPDVSDAGLLGVIYRQLPKKYFILTIHDQTSVSVYDIENNWSVVVEDYKAFEEKEKFEATFSEDMGAVLATRPESKIPAAVLLLPIADPVTETRQRFKVIDIANKGRVLRQETLECHEAFLTKLHTYVVARHHLNFVVFDVLSSRQKRIPDWDPEGAEVASADIAREVSPDDRFLAVGARHQIRIYDLSLNASCEPVAILDFTATCKEMKFTTCLPPDGDQPPPTLASYWDHLYYEDAGRMWVRYEHDGNRFVPLHKIDEARKELIHLSKTLMLAVQPVEEYSWEPQSTEGESLAVLRVDLDLQNVLDFSTLGCNVEKIGHSQRVLVTNKKSLRVLDFTIADRLVDSLTLVPDSVIIAVETASSRRSWEICAMVTSDPLSRGTQQFSMAKFLRTGPEMYKMPDGSNRFSPFGGKRFSIHFIPSYNPTHILFISAAYELSLYELDDDALSPVATVQNYVLPAKYDDSVDIHDQWLEVSTVKGIQMINMTQATSDEKYNPRDHFLAINASRGFRSINDNIFYVLRDKSASFSIYELKDDVPPVEVMAINRICDTENKFGAPEIDLDVSGDGRFLAVKNAYTFSADACFVLIFDLQTRSKIPILRRNYGQVTHTNFEGFFPHGSCIHYVICTPGGKSVEVYDLLAAAKEKKDPKPILQVSVDSNDFLKLSSSFRVRLDYREPRASGDEQSLEELLASLTDGGDTKKKKGADEKEDKKEEDEMTDDQKDSRSIFWISQKSNSSIAFYYLTPKDPPQLLRTLRRVFGAQEVNVDERLPYIYLSPELKKNECKLIKLIETKDGKIEMPDDCDYEPSLNGYTEIKRPDFYEFDNKNYMTLTNANEISVHILGTRSKEVFNHLGDTRKVQFEFCRGDVPRALMYTTGTSNLFLVDLVTTTKHKVLPNSRKAEKINKVSFDGDFMIVQTLKAVLIFEYKKEGDVRQAVSLVGEIDVDPTWPPGSWEFELRYDNKLAIVKRTDFSSCFAIYRNVRILEADSENTTKWPLLDVPIDQKTDPEWANAQIKFSGDLEYVYCYSPSKKGLTIFDLSRLLVNWYPIITWSSTENVLKYDLARSIEHMPNVDRFLRLYQDILVGPMSPKDPLSAINHLCTSNHIAIADGRHRALQLFLLHMPQGSFELSATNVPVGEIYPRKRRTVLGALISKKDWISISMLLDFLVIASLRHSLVPLADRCIEFGFELVDLAYQHSPTQVARFLKDFALQKLTSSSPVVQDAARSLRGVKFGKFRFLTCGSEIREPNKLWSSKLKANNSGDRFDVCYVAIPGLSSDRSNDYPTPVFHQLVQVAQDTQCAELIANPGVEAVIDFKWRTFARSRFLFNFGMHLFITLCVILFCSFLPLQDKTASLLTVAKTSEGALCIAMLSFFFAYAAYNIWKEARELIVQGVTTYVGVWNFAANVQSALLIATAVLYLLRSSQTHFVAGGTVIICHIYILFYLQALETTGPLIRMILQITSDMKYFTAVLVLCLVACTFFYIVVTEGTGIGAGNVAEVWLRMYMTFFFFNFDANGIDGLDTQEQITVSYLMIVVGSMFVAIVLLNLLIALMGDSFATIKARDTMELQLLRAGMIRDIEFTMQIKTAQMVKDRFPLWIHCLLPIKETQVRETNETLTELRKLQVEVAKLEERLEHMPIPGAGGGGDQRRGNVDPDKARESVKRGSVAASKRGSTSLDDLLKQLQADTPAAS